MSLILAAFIGLMASDTTGIGPEPSQPDGKAVVVHGNDFSLHALPPSTRRVAFPLLPHEWNRLDILRPRPVRIVDVPPGFEATLTPNGLLARTGSSDAWGYLTLETTDGLLQVTLLATAPFEEMKDGRIEGYSIGSYKREPLKGLSSYSLPAGFVRLTTGKEDAWISDRYRLRDIQCKQEGNPRFVVLRPEALIKLELLQDSFMSETDLRFDRFTIMSAYRTPAYNRSIGNKTSYSRHLYGDGIDIYVDRDGDSIMDDLNGDGVSDFRDAAMLLETAKRIDASPEWEWLKGGAGVYRRNRAHGPFLHIDTRGFIARWGAAP